MVLLHKIATAVLAITLISSPFLKTNDSFKQANATDSNQNLFLRVDDINDLKAGDKVIIANHFGAILDHFGGNPIYLVSRNYGGASGLGDKYFVADSLSNYQILNVDKVGDYFTFQFTYTYSYYWDKVVCGGKYFCYRQSDGTWGNGKVDLYGDLYFTDNKNSEYAQWKFSPNANGNGFFNMMRSGENDGTFITYQSGTTRDRFWYGGTQGQYQSDYGVRIYKYVNLDDYQHIFNTNDISQPNRTTFYQGEEIDLTGLEFNVYLLDKNFDINESTDIAAEAIYTIHSKYENEKGYYSSVTTEGSGETARGVFTYLGLTYRVFIQIIQESSESYQYQLIDYSMSDYRGTYYFGSILNSHPYNEYSEEDESRYSVSILKGTESDIGGTVSDLSMDISTEIIDVPESGASPNVVRSKFEVKRVVVNGVSNTYLYNPVYNRYLSYDNSDELCYVEENDLTSKEVFSVSNNKPVLNGNMFIIFNGSSFNVSSDDSNAISMFKLMPKASFYSELDGFVTTFFEKIQCVSGGSVNFTTSDWTDTKTAFDVLSVDVQGYLANLIYVHNGEEPGSAGDMVDRYDYILSKYPDTYVDYMNRKEAAYTNYYLNSQNIFDNQSIQQNTNLIIIFITIGLLTFVSIAFFIKKKKVK